MAAEDTDTSGLRRDGTRPFVVHVQGRSDDTLLSPAGELDLATVGSLRDRAEDALRTGCIRLVIDLRGLDFIDSTGLRLLISLHQRALRDGWELTLIQGPRRVRRLFEITRTAEVLPFTATAAATSKPAL
jgi:anti-anti-sigma factor